MTIDITTMDIMMKDIVVIITAADAMHCHALQDKTPHFRTLLYDPDNHRGLYSPIYCEVTMCPEIVLIESTQLDVALELVVLMRRIAFLKACLSDFAEATPETWEDVMRREQVIRQLQLLPSA